MSKIKKAVNRFKKSLRRRFCPTLWDKFLLSIQIKSKARKDNLSLVLHTMLGLTAAKMLFVTDMRLMGAGVVLCTVLWYATSQSL